SDGLRGSGAEAPPTSARARDHLPGPSLRMVAAKILAVRGGGETCGVLREELRRLVTWGERHRRLLARLLIVLLLTVLVDLVGAVLAWRFEEGVKGSDIHSFGGALFFSTVQILTVSSSLKNP